MFNIHAVAQVFRQLDPDKSPADHDRHLHAQFVYRPDLRDRMAKSVRSDAEPVGAGQTTKLVNQAIVGVNIGKTKLVAEEQAISDYVASASRLGPYADYVVVNVSSPNTPGLRDLQATEKLRPLLIAVREALDAVSPQRRVPLLVKIAPDLVDQDVDAVADMALELGLDGIIATNTTISREPVAGHPTAAEELVTMRNKASN